MHFSPFMMHIPVYTTCLLPDSNFRYLIASISSFGLGIINLPLATIVSAPSMMLSGNCSCIFTAFSKANLSANFAGNSLVFGVSSILAGTI